ncbi:MAG: APC family permease [Actinomycetes bacterium]
MSDVTSQSGEATDLSLTPVRDFNLRSAFALAFSDVSPIVGIYSVFGLGLAVAGPAFWWAFPIVLFGQLLVSGVFGDLVSKWPFQGSVFAWSRELAGKRFGWFTNWAYIWGFIITLAVVALAAAGFLGPALGWNNMTQTQTDLLATAVLAFGTIANMIGSKYLRALLYISVTCELLSSAGIGVAMFFHREHSFKILFNGMGTGHGSGWIFTAFLAVVGFVGFSFVGFESAGSIAEEVKESRRVLPKAIVLSLAAAGVLVMFASLALVLSIPDLSAVLAGTDTNPIANTLVVHLGSGWGRIFLAFLAIGFTASMIAVQASVSRAIWASARAREMPFSHILDRLSGKERLPRIVIGITATIAVVLMFILRSPKAYTLLLNASTAGIFASYLLPVVAAAVYRRRGRWTPGPVSMGKFGTTVTYVAAFWITLETINIAWPRNSYAGNTLFNWSIVLAIVVLGALGWIISSFVFRSGAEAMTAELEPDLSKTED